MACFGLIQINEWNKIKSSLVDEVRNDICLICESTRRRKFISYELSNKCTLTSYLFDSIEFNASLQHDQLSPEFLLKLDVPGKACLVQSTGQKMSKNLYTSELRPMVNEFP